MMRRKPVDWLNPAKVPAFKPDRYNEEVVQYEGLIRDSMATVDTLGYASLKALCQTLLEDMLPKNASPEKREERLMNMFASFNSFLGKSTTLCARDLAQIMAGWAPEIAAGVEYRGYADNASNPDISCWCPVRIAAEPSIFDDKIMLQMQVLAGPLTNTVITKESSWEFVDMLLNTIVGFKEVREADETIEGEDVGGMYAMLRIACEKGRIDIRKLEATTDMRKKNRILIHKREHGCIGPMDYNGCWDTCPVGQDQCPLSRHSSLWSRQPCRAKRDDAGVVVEHEGYILTQDGKKCCHACAMHGHKVPRR